MRQSDNVSQGKISEKIIKYMDFVLKTNQKKKQNAIHNIEATQKQENLKKNIRAGLCHGFAVVYAYMAINGQSEWWKEILKIILKWDGKESSLNAKIDMPIGSFIDGKSDKRSTRLSEVKSTYGKLLERVSNYILYNFGCTSMTGIEGLQQRTFLSIGGPFHSVQGGIQFLEIFSGCFDREKLKNLLLLLKETQSVEKMVIIVGPQHACAIKWEKLPDSLETQWYLYNPNMQSGELSFKNIDELISEIEKPSHLLGQNLAIRVASLEKESDENGLTAIKEYVTQFYQEKNLPVLLSHHGLHRIAYHSPNQLPHIPIFNLMRTQNTFHMNLISAVTERTNNGNTVLDLITGTPNKLSPNELTQLIKLTVSILIDEAVKNYIRNCDLYKVNTFFTTSQLEKCQKLRVTLDALWNEFEKNPSDAYIKIHRLIKESTKEDTLGGAFKESLQRYGILNAAGHMGALSPKDPSIKKALEKTTLKERENFLIFPQRPRR